MAVRIDIHNFAKKVDKLIGLINDLGVSSRTHTDVPISRRNAEFIIKYDITRSLNGIGLATRHHGLHTMLTVARLLNKDFDRIDKEDIKTMVASVNRKYGAWRSSKTRMTFKNFYKWLKQGDDYIERDDFPDEVRWIRRGIKISEISTIERSDCWNEEEEKKLISAAINPRDRALASVVTEGGARIGEVGGLRIRDVYSDEFSFLLHLDGKTGKRDIRVVYSGPSLAEWLEVHPGKGNPDAPLFCHLGEPRMLSYNTIRNIFVHLCKRAGLDHKKMNPHIFRHSKETILSSQGWPQPLINEFLGWTKDSKMPRVYSHINSRDANLYMLKKHGIAAREVTEPKMKLQICALCHAENGPDASFCKKCRRPLTHKAMLKYNHERNKASSILDKLVEDPEFVIVMKQFIDKLSVKNTSKSMSGL
jgi:integrase/recombinase XerD